MIAACGRNSTVAVLLGIAIAVSSVSVARVRAHEGRARDEASPNRHATKAAPVPPDVVLTQIAGPLGGITAITHAGDGRLFITLQRGRILVWDGATILPTPFLDISNLIVCCGEQGLLSTAFHPSYAENGFFYVDYTEHGGDTVIARYSVSSNSERRRPVQRRAAPDDRPAVRQPQRRAAPVRPRRVCSTSAWATAAARRPMPAQRMAPQPGRRTCSASCSGSTWTRASTRRRTTAFPPDNPFVASGGPRRGLGEGPAEPVALLVRPR